MSGQPVRPEAETRLLPRIAELFRPYRVQVLLVALAILITSGLGRFIYRLARKAAGKDDAKYSVKEIYKRSCSTQEYRFFQRDLRDLVARTAAFPMPDYDLAIVAGQDGPMLTMKRREDGDGPTDMPLLDALEA